MPYTIRKITPKDDAAIEKIIRTCLIEYGANHEGTAWTDPSLSCFSKVYTQKGSQYWVVEDEDGMIVGGVGIGPLDNKICELQKMYFLKEARGKGIASKLLQIALNYAKQYYTHCYLETLENMIEAQKLYEKHGFSRTYEKSIQTEHYACDVHYLKEL